MTLNCAVLDDYQDVALSMADWSSLEGSVEVRSLHEHFGSEEEVAAAVGDCEILVVMRERTPFPASLLDRLPRLRLLITSGMRNASIDLAAAARNGVTVCGTASNSEPPAELTWALILGLARHVATESGALREGGPWQSTVGADLHGRTLALLGLGKIGAKVAAVGRAFGMDVLAWSQNLTEERAAEHGVRRAGSLGELLEAGDFVSVHLQLGERTRGLIGAGELKRMRRTAYLVNTSRAAIVDQEALVLALREGWIAGGGHRRLRGGTAARRPPAAHGPELPRPAPPRLRHPPQLRGVLQGGGRGHRRLSRGQPRPYPGGALLTRSVRIRPGPGRKS